MSTLCPDSLVDEILEGKWAPREETVGDGLWSPKAD